MRRFTFLVLMLTPWAVAQDRQPGRIPIGKDTTVLLGPVTADGYVDYVQALNDRLGRGIRPEDNALVLIARAFGPEPSGKKVPAEFFRILNAPAPSASDRFMVDFMKFYRAKYKPVGDQDLDVLQRMGIVGRKPWTATEFPECADWLKTYDEQMNLVVQASKRTQYFHPLVVQPDKNGNKSPSLAGANIVYQDSIRTCFQALTARAMFQTAAGQVDEAWQDLMACRRLAYFLATADTLPDSLVSFAGRVIAVESMLVFLSEAKLTEAQLQRCLADLNPSGRAVSIPDLIDGHGRFEVLDFVQALHHAGATEMPSPANPLAIWDLALSQRSDRAKKLARESIDWNLVFRDQVAAFSRLSRILATADRQTRTTELRNLIAEVDRTTKEIFPVVEFLNDYLWWLPFDWFRQARSRGLALSIVDLYLPAYEHVCKAFDRCTQSERNLQIAIALARFKVAHGRYPEKLAELTPRYLDHVPDDLFASKPMIYRLTADGYLLYSVGINGKDDGGKTYGDEVGHDDVRVRMPMPKNPK